VIFHLALPKSDQEIDFLESNNKHSIDSSRDVGLETSCTINLTTFDLISNIIRPNSVVNVSKHHKEDENKSDWITSDHSIVLIDEINTRHTLSLLIDTVS